MYYKITNTKSNVYKKLHELRTKERQIMKNNLAAIEEKVGLKFKTFLGHNSQQNFRRVPQFTGFKFLNPEKVDLNVWKIDKEHKDIYVPNRKTKVGREMAEFLLNGLEGSRYDAVFDILELEHLRKFSFPYVEICGKTITIFLGNDFEPKDKNLIEITKKEFDKITFKK